MSTFSKISNTSTAAASSSSSEEDVDKLRRGPWTAEEDSLLIHCIACHGEGHWNLLAKRSGLKRTGKSCRLRWLNYLKPDVKRGNLTPHEQLLILELHSKWGNRWSRIAQHLPGRTDNEIKNYWRTRVQKQARHLKIDSNSSDFSEIIRCLWMPSLIRKIQRSSSPFATPFENSAKLRSPGSHTLPPPQVSPQFNISSNIWPSDQSMHVTKNHHNLECPINQFQVTGTNSFDMESFSLTPKSAVLPEFCDPTGDELPEKNCWMDGDKLEECLWGIDEIWKLR